ncbi:hypothetical protein QEZ54_15815 [Catellatospora sp. KI3]|uniref:hypothetical protein n=1 Tax=Catellatospora sp. KI3 TaxID=3041620 RepID=UPI0024828686|nr:hypothetical protein [Catellatospora sp. KI3]MDI1462438.1 hypothetical protein [Catellatospora sp. KI3]
MTSPDPSSARVAAALQPLRVLFVLGLLVYPMLHLIFRFFDWVVSDNGSTLAARSVGAGFADLLVMSLPLVAVLIATLTGPVLPGARLFSLIALGEYAFALFFGVFAYLIGFGMLEYIGVLDYLVLTLARLGLVALAGFTVLRVFIALGGQLTVPAALRNPQAPPPPQV